MGRGGRRLLAAGALAAIAGAAPAHAAFPGANGPVVFASDRDGDFDVYAIDAGGGEPRNLTRAAGRDVTPSVSADGTRIAFQSDRAGSADLFVMGADGSGQRNLTQSGEDDLDPAFSPDGARVAWARNVDGNLEIHAMSAVDGSGMVNLTNSPFPDLDPAWSPDGSRIAFVRSLFDDFEIHVMNADGSGQVNLTNAPGVVDAAPSFSPDGSRIAFHSSRDGNSEIYVMGADGADPVRLTHDLAADTSPAFSPDGSRIVFRSNRSGNYELHVMDADGSDVTALTQHPGVDQWPDWAVAPAAPPPVAPPPASSPPAPPAPAPAPEPERPAPDAQREPPPSPAAAAPASPPPERAAVSPSTTAGATAAARRAPSSRPTPRPPPAAAPDPAPPAPVPGAAPLRAGGVPADPPAANPERSRFAASLLRPDALAWSPGDVGRSLGIALLLAALLGFPARLFNATARSNREDLARMLRPAARLLDALTPGRSRVLLGFAGTSVFLGSALHWFLDPGFPGRPGSGAYAVGFVAGLATIVGALLTAARAWFRHRLPEVVVGWQVFLGQLVVAGVCVLVSRLAQFVPGLILGMAGDVRLSRPVGTEEAGRLYGFLGTCVLLLSLTAWFASIPVGDAAAEPGTGFAVLALDTALVVIAVAGMELLVFVFAPFMFLEGYKLFRWNRRVWLALWGSGALWFSFVVLNPALSHYEGRAHASAAWLAALFAFELLVAVAFWGFFVLRARRAAAGSHRP